MTTTRDELLDWLELERIDRDIYRGRPSAWPRQGSLYGGLVAGQALLAAANTVPEGRRPHSLHGYFLRPGVPTEPVVFSVDRDRDGRSFSARRVAALQDGKVIWEMTCSFHEPADGPEYVQAPPAGVAAPDVSPGLNVPSHPLAEMRFPDAADGSRPPGFPMNRVWARSIVPLGDDPLVHACVHVYMSDLTTGFSHIDMGGTPPGGPSIDHAMWFHRISRADEWVLYDCTPAKLGGHRGLYTGTAHDQAGNLVAILAQEMLLRPPTASAE